MKRPALPPVPVSLDALSIAVVALEVATNPVPTGGISGWPYCELFVEFRIASDGWWVEAAVPRYRQRWWAFPAQDALAL